MKIPLLVGIILMITLLAVPLAVNLARAVPGLSVTDPANIWSPYGTYAATPALTLKHVMLKYYSGDPAEYAAFQAGGANGLDIGDSGTAGTGPPPSTWPQYDAIVPPGIDWNITLPQPSGNWQGIYFNGASSRVNGPNNWGCDWHFYNSACGIEMRQAFAHLINRPDFVTANDANGVGGAAIWDDVPGNKVLSSAFSPSNPGGCPTLPSGTPPVSCTFSSPSSNFCSWDTIDNTGCTKTIGPYVVGGTGATLGFPAIPNGAIASCPANISPVTNPAAWSGCTNDFAVAAAHLVRAGVASAMSQDGHYQIGAFLTNPTKVANNHFRACVRVTSPRRNMGDGFVNAMDLLFGMNGAKGDVADVRHGGVVTCGLNAVFSEPPTSPVDDWDMYTYGYSDASPFPVYLFTQFSTQFSYNNPLFQDGIQCGGAAAFAQDFPTNPTFTCIDGRLGNPSADTALLQAASNDNLVETTFDNKMALSPGSALDILGRDVASIPVHTLNVRTPSLRAVSGLTNTKGLGFDNPVVFNLAHKGPYVPNDGRYAFNGGGSADTIRWGQAQGISYLNPFQAGTVWEFQTLSLVYDTVFAANPIRTQQIFCQTCQTYSTDTSTVNTKITVELRQNLEFQDGTPVTAKDVAFSYLTLRDQASVLSGPLGLLLSVALNPTDPFQLIITMQGHSVGHLPNLAGVTILPISRWACAATPCGTSAFSNPNQYNVGLGGTTFPGVDLNKAGPGYDPVLDNNFLGSALFMCSDDTGTVIGGGCAKNSLGQSIGQSVDPGGSVRLSLFDRTSGPAALNDPFAQYTRLNNPTWGTGSGAAAESGQLQEFLYSQRGATQQVSFTDLQEITNNCFGATSFTSLQGGLTCPDYTYWVRASLHPSTPGTIGAVEVVIVNSHFLDGGVLPFSWTGAPPQVGVGTLDNIIPFTQHCPPYGTGTPPNCF